MFRCNRDANPVTGQPSTLSPHSSLAGKRGVSAACNFSWRNPMIETLPLEQAADAYARMLQGKARFRMVLVNG